MLQFVTAFGNEIAHTYPPDGICENWGKDTFVGNPGEHFPMIKMMIDPPSNVSGSYAA